MITPEQKQKYFETGGGQCPFCRSKEIEGTGDMETDSDWMTNRIECLTCGKTWDDIYTLSDIEET